MSSSTLKDYREQYYTASTKAGDIARQLGLAGIALVWLFQRTEKNVPDSYSLPEELYAPTLWIVISLALDLLQYVYKSILWGWVQRHLEKKYSPDITQSYLVSEYFNWPTLGLFWAKLFSIGVAYFLLLVFVIGHVQFSAKSIEPYTLYRTSIKNANSRIHVATFSSTEASTKSSVECENVKSLMQGGGNKLRYWCEVGAFKKEP